MEVNIGYLCFKGCTSLRSIRLPKRCNANVNFLEGCINCLTVELHLKFKDELKPFAIHLGDGYTELKKDRIQYNFDGAKENRWWLSALSPHQKTENFPGKGIPGYIFRLLPPGSDFRLLEETGLNFHLAKQERWAFARTMHMHVQRAVVAGALPELPQEIWEIVFQMLCGTAPRDFAVMN